MSSARTGDRQGTLDLYVRAIRLADYFGLERHHVIGNCALLLLEMEQTAPIPWAEQVYDLWMEQLRGDRPGPRRVSSQGTSKCRHAAFLMYTPGVSRSHDPLVPKGGKMRWMRMVALLVPVVLTGVLPAMAAEPAAAPDSEVAPPISAPAQPAEFPWLMPEPIETAGQTPGPCTVTVPCRFGPTISCSSQTVCYWQYDSKYIRGYVSCGGVGTTYCPTQLDPG